MKEKKFYINNVLKAKKDISEEVLINVAEQLEAKIVIKDFSLDTEEVLDAPVIIMCDGSIELEDAVLEQLKQQYESNQHIVLVNPTNKVVNTVYKKLEKRNYCVSADENNDYTIFGLKLENDSIRCVLEAQATTETEQADNIVQFIKDKYIPDARTKQVLKSNACKALKLSSDSEDDLSRIAKQHLITKSFTLLGKPCSLTYYMVSCHQFVGTDSDGGEDWFFIQQHGILNGGPGYDKHWAHTRIKVNGESWYVGEGDVCLNYIDYYKMQNYFSGKDRQVDVDLVDVAPQSTNNLTTCTVSEDISVNGTAGFEGGTNEMKGTASFSCKAGFSNSYSFQIQDCECKGESLIINNASAEWAYSFKRASQNRNAGQWQHLYEPANLARSTFSPINSWVWRFDTKNRETYKAFTSNFQLGIMNTISRYSGSQSPKDIPGNDPHNSNSFAITLNMPPLLGVDAGNLIFDNDSGTKDLEIASQGSWALEFKDKPSWVRANTKTGSGECTRIYISVESNTATTERQATLQIYRTIGNTRSDDELVEVNILQSAGKIQ
jgi:hypothetical protein